MLELIGVFGIKMKNLSIEKFLIHYMKIDSMKAYTSYLCFLIVFLITSCEQPVRDLNPESLEGGFQLLDAKTTGIDFDNSIKESAIFNHFYYSQIYVGSGVAIGDINNDGLSDVFFGGNQVNDGLYLNKGDLNFEDISQQSGIGNNEGWTWGVTMADVNSDGFLDIYVSRNGMSFDMADRRNKLYINNQDLTFTESAIAYGLADPGFSTQAVFFDMDNDGDLDMYQVNQLPDKKLLLVNKVPKKQFKYLRDKLYRNDNGKFIDVTRSSGISNDVSYGLSVSASDFNNDGWMDLYVANDYAEPDFMYQNNGNGTFTNVVNEQFMHITQLSMGSDTGDMNNDGLLDLITTDMTPEDHYRSKTNMASMSAEAFKALIDSGAHRQYMANSLQINTGKGTFFDVANMAGIASTDWSWASLLVDLDNDGYKDIVVSNGIKKDVDNNDFRNTLTDLDSNTSAEELFELSQKAPSVPISNYAFRNKGNLEFEKVSKPWGFDTPSFSSGMAYGDLDNDGDLDLVLNNMESKAFVYENKATGNFLKINLQGPKNNKFGIGVKAKIYYGNNLQVSEHILTRGFISSVEPGLFFGLGKETMIERAEVIWPDGKQNTLTNVQANQFLTVKYKEASIKVIETNTETTLLEQINTTNVGVNYVHQENYFDEFTDEILLPHNISQNGPFSAIADVNGDGFQDLFIGGALDQSGIMYLQTSNGNFRKASSQPWEKDKNSEDLQALFFDVDNDGDKDLYVTSGGTENKRGSYLLKDRLYINDGNGSFVKDTKALPNIYEHTQVVKTSDIDDDGDLDLFVGVRSVPGKYAYPGTSYLLINNKGVFNKANYDIAPDLTNLGMVTDAVFSDVDQDGDEDLMVVGEWMTVTLLVNNKGVFINESDNYGLSNTRGLWWCITANDLDNDGDEDYIIGNLGKNNKFKASKEHPFKVYVNDFDENGTNDIVLSKFYKDDYVPVRGRECTSQQMPYVAEKFEDFHSFASSTLLDILPQDKVESAVIYEISNFESIILMNDEGQLRRKVLPNQVQVAPIKSILVDDVNDDGIKDILTVGNHFGVEVETVRYDAGVGGILLGNGRNNYKYTTPLKSGFYVPFDSREIKLLHSAGGQQKYLVLNNNDTPLLFKKNTK